VHIDISIPTRPSSNAYSILRGVLGSAIPWVGAFDSGSFHANGVLLNWSGIPDSRTFVGRCAVGVLIPPDSGPVPDAEMAA
jgi:hypothetical protein